MRKINLTFLTSLAITVAALWTPSASGQVTGIFDWDKSWQYFQQGIQPTNQGTLTWRTNTYNDTAWAPGQGVLAFETTPGPYPPILTTLSRTVPNGASNNITYYFRTHFNFPTNPTNAILFFTNVVDDGLILYLNGVRLYDIRVATTTPTWGTLAGNTPTEGARELITVTNTPLLRQGDNVLAVEVHDTAVDSSDIAFGLQLGYRMPLPIVITRHPTNEDVFVGDTVDLSVDVTGDSPRYWWFRNDTLLRGPTNSPILRLSNIQLANAGTYHVVVSNTISGARSSNAIVNVRIDDIPPVLLNAVINQGEPSNRVYAIFSEDVLRITAIRENCPGPSCTTNYSRSATNVNNYALRQVAPPGTEIEVLSALPGTGSRSVRLTLATNIDCNKEYMLTVRDLTDGKTNVMSPNPGYAIVGCAYRTNLIDFYGTWSYAFAYEGSGMDPNWYSTNYVEDGNWFSAAAPFVFSNECEENCFGFIGQGGNCPSTNTAISFGFPSYLFRYAFVLPTNMPAVGLLRITNVIDDGAVIYLNDKELIRYNVPSGPLDFNVIATNCVEAVCQSINLTLNNVRPGTNVLAVRVHDCNEQTGVDVMFGLHAELTFTNFPTQIPEIRIARDATPRRVRLNWDTRGWRLQTATAITGVWANVAGVSTNAMGYTNNSVPFTGNRFYRLCRP